MANSLDQTKSLSWTSAGIYNLTVNATNSVSNKINTTLVSVQDELTDLSLTLASSHLAYNEQQTITVIFVHHQLMLLAISPIEF